MAHLKGMLEISNYARRSESTILQWIRDLGFPAKKITCGVWESDTDLIDRWRLQQFENDIPPMELSKKKPVKQGRNKRK